MRRSLFLCIVACAVFLDSRGVSAQSATEVVKPGIDPIAVHTLSRLNFFSVAPALLGLSFPTRATVMPDSTDAVAAISDEDPTTGTQLEVEPSVLAIQKSGLTNTVTTFFRYITTPNLHTLTYSAQKPRTGTWSSTLLPLPVGYDSDGDPNLDGNFSTVGVAPKRIYNVGLLFNSTGGKTGVGVWRSDDAGVTWSGPTVVDTRPAGNILVDKPAITVTPGVTTQAGWVYAAYVIADMSNAANFKIYVAGSLDGGVTFGAPVLVVTGNVSDPQIVSEPTTGALYVVYPNYSDRSIRMKKSTSAGVAWDPETVAVTGRAFVMPGTEQIGGGVWALTLPTARYNARAVCVSVVWHEREAQDVSNRFTDVWYVAKTATGWLAPVKISDSAAGKDQFYPALDYDESGNMFVGFYDRRESPTNSLYKEYAANIKPDGSPLGPNFATSTFTTDPSQLSPRTGFVGDYQSTFYSNYGDLQQWVSAFSGGGGGGLLNSIWLAHLN